jgi:hypothetical protein
MGTELPTKVMLGQTLVLIKMTFLNDVRKVGRLVLSRTSCLLQKTETDADGHLSATAVAICESDEL